MDGRCHKICLWMLSNEENIQEEEYIQDSDEYSDEGYKLEVDVKYLKELDEYTVIFYFYPKK